MRSRWGGFTDSISIPRFSRTSRAIISIFTDTMEEYAAAKRLLFAPREGPAPQWAVLNRGRSGERGHVPRAAGVLFGTACRAKRELRAENIRSGFDGLRFDLCYQSVAPASRIRAGGPHQRAEHPRRAGAGLSYGMDLSAIARGIAACRAVPGRFERVDRGQPFLVVVDYAHTDDALRNVIQIARELTRGPGDYAVRLRRGSRPHQASA